MFRSSRPVFTVGEDNILPPVVIVVDEGDAGSERLWQVSFSGSTAIVDEANSSGLADVGELSLLPVGADAGEHETDAGATQGIVLHR